MSNVYILEPPTSGKVLLKTTVGDIDVELWAKETPKTCRNFIQLCLEGYYDNTTFHRVVKGFIVQGGDPNGDGTGGQSIYDEPFKDEFHQRLKFTRRGLLAMANAGKDDNGSQFFFTLGATPELQDKHTIFGKITGDTVYNMLKLEEGLLKGETPVYPHKVLKTEVLHNPFSDIEPRIKEVVVKEKSKKEKKPGVKNFKLLSFGAEAEEDEEESTRENEKFVGKGKSTHDVLDDPKLSSQTELEKPKVGDEDEDEEDEEEKKRKAAEQLENIKKKLKGSGGGKSKSKPVSTKVQSNLDDDEAISDYLRGDHDEQCKKKVLEIQKEIESVKKDYHKNKFRKDQDKIEEIKVEEIKSDTFKAYKNEYDKYKEKKESLPKKGAGRESFTLQLLEKFKKKLHSAIESDDDSEDGEGKVKDKAKEKAKNEDLDDIDDEKSLLSHKLHFVEDKPVLAKDANTKDDDWFEIYDPRNPLNKRRRGEQSKSRKK